MKSLGLVSCTKTKRNYPCKASQMCSSSTLFSKAFDYASSKYDAVAILSGKYGLLLPDDEIEPYDRFLNDLNIEQVKEWSNMVFNQMKQKLNLNDFSEVYFHAGERYRKYLIPMLERLGIKCVAPLKNLSIGKQLQWYNAPHKIIRKRGGDMRKPFFEKVWKRIVVCERQEFRTVTNLPFTYEIRGDYLAPSRTEYKISKSDVAKAYALLPLSGPGEISKLVRGPSYVYAILHDERISRKKW